MAPQVLVLGLLFIAIACLPDFTWPVGAGRLRHRLANLRRRIVERVSAGVYALLATGLAATNRSTG